MSSPVGRGYLDGPQRLAGLDLARGCAVLGMLAAHLIALPLPEPGDPATWIGLASGRSSILFATLAGVSLALVTGGVDPVTGAPRRVARKRIAVRAALLWFIGVALIATGVPVYVILPAYALLFLLALPLLGLRARTLWTLAVLGALVLPWLQPFWNALPVWESLAGPARYLPAVLGWQYPFTLWIVFLMAGLAIGRSTLWTGPVPLVLVVAGLAVAVLTPVVGALVQADPGSLFALVWTTYPHSGGILEVFSSGGGAVATIGACLLLCRTRVRAVLLPLRAIGAMPLTAYVGQLVVWAILAAALFGDVGDLTRFRALDPFWAFAIATAVLCTAWALLWGRGPLERLLAACVRRVVPAPR